MQMFGPAHHTYSLLYSFLNPSSFGSDRDDSFLVNKIKNFSTFFNYLMLSKTINTCNRERSLIAWHQSSFMKFMNLFSFGSDRDDEK